MGALALTLDTLAGLVTRSPDDTVAMGAAFAGMCRAGDVIGLAGTLGAGKTCFVRGLAAGLGVSDLRQVISPTFVLLRHYVGRMVLNHFDAYRLRDAAAMEALGCHEVFDEEAVSVVEWADNVETCLPARTVWVRIAVTGASTRAFSLATRDPSCRDRFSAASAELLPWVEHP
jgi:tRNA threonylcarbamoyladenosine biosynthesis protein TsaE